MRLVAGPSDVYICHLCVALCNEILAEQARAEQAAGAPATPPERSGGGWIGATSRQR